MEVFWITSTISGSPTVVKGRLGVHDKTENGLGDFVLSVKVGIKITVTLEA